MLTMHYSTDINLSRGYASAAHSISLLPVTALLFAVNVSFQRRRFFLFFFQFFCYFFSYFGSVRWTKLAISQFFWAQVK